MSTTIEKCFHEECKLRAKASRVSELSDANADANVSVQAEEPGLVAGGLRVATAATTGTKRPLRDVVGEEEDSVQPKRRQAGLEVCLKSKSCIEVGTGYPIYGIYKYIYIYIYIYTWGSRVYKYIIYIYVPNPVTIFHDFFFVTVTV